MAVYLVGFSNKLTTKAKAIGAVLKKRGAIELWEGVWVIALDERPEVLLSDFISAEAIFAVPVDADGSFFSMGRAAGPAAQIYFSERIAPLLTKRREGGEKFATVRYCGRGKKLLGAAVAAYRKQRAVSTAATPLCRIMLEHGSDKGLGWHNYTPFYAALFENLRAPVSTLFEVGLGTNHEDTPSNMGVHGIPGASLRGWREYFPDARIYGGDIDRRILFEEKRIQTFFMDQTRPETIRRLWNSLLETRFDVFIDDGLHGFEAAQATFDASFDRVRSGGLYIIEDVNVKEAGRYLDMIAARGCNGLSIEIFHPTNSIDNCLVVACGAAQIPQEKRGRMFHWGTTSKA